MTPEVAKDKRLGVKMQNLRGITCSGIPQSSKQGGHEWPQKPPEIENWGSFLQNVHLWPHVPF